MEFTPIDFFTLVCRGFFLVFIRFFQGLTDLQFFWLMIAALTCYAVVCLVWSLILDD